MAFCCPLRHYLPEYLGKSIIDFSIKGSSFTKIFVRYLASKLRVVRYILAKRFKDLHTAPDALHQLIRILSEVWHGDSNPAFINDRLDHEFLIG